MATTQTGLASHHLTTENGRQPVSRYPSQGFDFPDLGKASEPTHGERRLIAEAWHAFRRRWFFSLAAGAIVGSVVVACVWFGIPRQYTATAILRISSGRSTVLNLNDHGEGVAAFDIFKRTQRQYIRSPHILTSVLQREEVASKIKAGPTDPLAWLQQIVSVTYPDDAEIMLVSVRMDDRETAETIANKIVDVYLEDVNDAERQQKISRMNDLEKAYADSEANLRKKRNEIRQYADALGTADGGGLTLSQKNAVQEYLTLWTKLNQVDIELIQWTSARKPSGDVLGAADPSTLASSAEEEVKTTVDPVVSSLTAQMEHIQAGIDDARRRYAVDSAAFKRFSAEQQPEVDRLREKISERRTALQKNATTRLQMSQAVTAERLKTSISALQSQRKLLADRVDALRKEAEKFGRPSVDVELMQAEIKAMEEIQNFIQRELHEAKVEVASSKPRTSLLSAAVAPQSEALKSHLELCGLSGAFGFFASLGLVVAWDLRRRRLNTASEVSRLLRLPLLGTVPPLTTRPDSLHRAEKAMDAIAATMVFSTPEESHRLLLVTSAAPAEGKTTVAAGLAMSLARMGRPTVLVDFDLQCPLLHEMFGLNIAPGTADLLADRLEPVDAARPTSIDNLSVVPAGQWGQSGFAAWSNDRVKRMLSELRLSFAHVVIDTAPLLPSVETRLLVPHVDGVIISLLRDVSEVQRVRSACDMLRSVEAPLVGAVMVGAPGEHYERRKTPAMQFESGSIPSGEVPVSSLGEAIIGEEDVIEVSQESGLRR
jgi:polysaccharide biosynthesis transport protein